MVLPFEAYKSGEYLAKNPTWDMEDSPWKAAHVARILKDAGIAPSTLCEVGCGAGRVLEALAGQFPECELFGFDIAPQAASFWKGIDNPRIHLRVGDFFQLDRAPHYDALLLLDVLEHVADPHDFLARIRGSAEHFVFHFPLDLSASAVLREQPLLHVRRKVGHIHYFTRGLALELLRECGFEVVESRYTGAAFNAPQRTLKTKLAQLPRRIAYALNKEWGVRLLGGETLMVLARPGKE